LSIKTKLSTVISLIVTVFLIANNFLNYVSTKEALLQDQEQQMEMIAKEVRIAIENSEIGSRQVEDLIGRELRVAAIAAKHALDPDINNVTNEQLRQLADKLGISDITLFAPVGDDIVGLKSSDPKEIGLSTKDWGYWFTALKQLLENQSVSIPEGQKLPNYWAGPIDVASSDPVHVSKWGYYYDGTTNYIIDPYVKDVDIREYERLTGPKAVIEKTLANNSALLEITGFNPRTFGREPIITKNNGVEYIELGNRPILFGDYTYQDKRDQESIEQATKTGKLVRLNTVVNDKRVIKSFIPIHSAPQPYVIGVVTDYQVVQDVLNKQLLNNVLISLTLVLIVFVTCYLLAGRIVRPLHHILQKVNEIAEGNFGSRVLIERRDELGLLAEQVNLMSENLHIYTTELQAKSEQIRYQAYHDPLTGLANRRMFNDRLQEAIAEAKQTGDRIALFYLDVDRFKSVNDTLGHSMGDLLLQEIAERLTDCVPDLDSVARLGGDEFTVILPKATEEQIAALANSILKKLSEPVMLRGYELFIAPSIGVALYPQDGEDLEVLLKHADTAMYHAKEQGGNRYQLYTAEMKSTDTERMELESRLRKAIERDELELYYQPKLHLKTGEISGLETLVRWHNSELGLVPPAKFIPLAEENGLIIPIGAWVLRTACEQAKKWQVAGHKPLRIAVNLSPRQFLAPDLITTVADVLRETGLDPKYLELEITESILMQNTEQTLNTLQMLKEMGIRISIDDFGTGYSSLSYLKRFPFDMLKIDQAFVRDIAHERKDAEIVAAIISLAHSLDLDVVAEGVETEEQYHFLREYGCDELQGFLFHRPMSAQQFEQTLLQRSQGNN
jgi:diguanylate cyclase (GGDEF)-like protein